MRKQKPSVPKKRSISQVVIFPARAKSITVHALILKTVKGCWGIDKDGEKRGS